MATLIQNKGTYDEAGEPTSYWADTTVGPTQFFATVPDHQGVMAELRGQDPKFAPKPDVPKVKVNPDPALIQPMDGGGANPTPRPGTGTFDPAFGASSGGLVNQVESTTQRMTLPKDVQNKLDEREKVLADAVIATGKAQTAVAEAEATAAQAKSVQTQRYLDEESARRQDEQVRANETFQSYQKVKDEYKSMSVDANRMWHQASTGDKIMAGFAIVLGGLGGALQGNGSNVGLDVIQRAVDRDIDEQKANIAKKASDVAEARGMYSDLLQKFGNEHAARLATQEMVLSKLAVDAEALSKQREGTLAGTKAAQAAEELKLRSAEKQAELVKVVQTDVTKKVPLKGRGELATPDSLAKFADSEAQIDNLGGVIDRLNKGEVRSGLFQDLHNKATDMFGTQGNIPSKVLARDMNAILNDYVQKHFGASMTASEKSRAVAAIAEFRESPKSAAAKLQDVQDDMIKRYQRERETIGYGRDLPPIGSQYIKARSHKIQK